MQGEAMNPSVTTVILEKQTRQAVLLRQLKETPSIGNVSYVSLNVFLNTLERDERNKDWFEAALTIQQMAHQAGILETTCRYPITTDHMMTFIQRMADEGWTVEDLPEQSPKDQALKAILKVLVPKFDRRVKQWAAFEIKDLSSIAVYQHFYPAPIQRRLTQLTQRGLTVVELPQKTPQVRVHFAKNPRAEAQACVQDMMKDALPYDEQVIVCLDPNQQDVVERFLIDAEIPYTRTSDYRSTAAIRLFGDLLKVTIEPTRENLLHLIQNDRLGMKQRLSLVQYLNHFKPTIDELLSPLTHVKTAFDNPTLMAIADHRALLKLETRAEVAASSIREILTALSVFRGESYSTLIEPLFELYAKTFITMSETDIQSINAIKGLLEEGHSVLCSMADPFPVLLYRLEKLTLSTKQSSGVVLTDLRHSMVHGSQRIYLLGCTQDGYPQVPTQSGLFDDDYLRRIKGYDARRDYDLHIKQLDALRASAEEVVYSMPLGSYDGKAQKWPASLEAEFEKKQFKAKAWTLVESYAVQNEKTAQLDPKTAKQLFFTEDTLRGSVSSFERYFKCPYQYFLHTGIGLGSTDSYGLSNREIGTMMHKILEDGINAHGKAYAEALQTHEATLIAPYIQALKELYPKEEARIDLLRERTHVLLQLSLRFLAEREKNSEFAPTHLEQKFNEIIDLDRSIKLNLVGTIDRIDTMPGGFVVLDYKSSTKKMHEPSVMLGVQLQLVTYMWMGRRYLNLNSPYGVFYFSFGQGDVKILANAEKTPEEVWKESRRLHGWIMEDPQAIDRDAKHIVSLKIRKSDGAYTYNGGEIDSEALEKQVKALYGTLIDELQEGVLKKRNLAGSCTYCDYRFFCQHKQDPIKIPRIKRLDSVLRKAQ
jgi:ATP-dependent helicase/nuclease subunit B